MRHPYRKYGTLHFMLIKPLILTTTIIQKQTECAAKFVLNGLLPENWQYRLLCSIFSGLRRHEKRFASFTTQAGSWKSMQTRLADFVTPI